MAQMKTTFLLVCFVLAWLVCLQGFQFCLEGRIEGAQSLPSVLALAVALGFPQRWHYTHELCHTVLLTMEDLYGAVPLLLFLATGILDGATYGCNV